MTRNIYWNSERLDQFQKQNAFITSGFPDQIAVLDTLEQLKFEFEKELGFRNLQEKIKMVICYQNCSDLL